MCILPVFKLTMNWIQPALDRHRGTSALMSKEWRATGTRLVESIGLSLLIHTYGMLSRMLNYYCRKKGAILRRPREHHSQIHLTGLKWTQLKIVTTQERRGIRSSLEYYELGWIDIYTETALLSQHLALPRIGHLETVYHIFAYLSKHEKSSIIFDPHWPSTLNTERSETQIGHPSMLMRKEELPPRMPELLGHPVNIYTFVDANHAWNVATRRSHTGVLLFVQNSPIIWLSRQSKHRRDINVCKWICSVMNGPGSDHFNEI